MTPELTILIYAALLQVGQILLAVIFSDAQTGLKYGAGPRDTPQTLRGMAGRLDRAHANHYVALSLFAVAVMVLHLSGQSSPLTLNCAWAYLLARIAYVPAYASGIPYIRSVFWGIGFGATTIMLVTAIL